MLRVSHPSKERVFSVSKWIKHQVLLDPSEMGLLLEQLAPFHFFNVGAVVPFEEMKISTEKFLETYRQYINLIKEGIPVFNSKQYYPLSSAMTTTPEVLYAFEVEHTRYMAKPLKPLVQIQPHRFLASSSTGSILPMVMSESGVIWGVQFSYPQLFHDGASGRKVDRQFPNTHLFFELVKWLRNHTFPTTFIWKGHSQATSLRLGKGCFTWINDHPQLQKEQMIVRSFQLKNLGLEPRQSLRVVRS